MRPDAPIIDSRARADMLESLLRNLPGYLPAWMPQEGTSAKALMQIFARYLEIYAKGLNQVPERSQLAFLDMLGMSLLPAQAARAPLVFTLAENAASDVTLPAGCRVAAVATPPSPHSGAGATQTAPAEVLFATNQTLTLTRSRLSSLYSVNPGSDEFADHSQKIIAGFTLFDDMDLTEHAVYLGHDELFNLVGDNMVVMISLTLDRYASKPLATVWEYLSENGWSPLESTAENDTTGGLRQDGMITLRRAKGPDAKQETLAGHKSYWLRGRLASPLLPDGPRGERSIPKVNDIRARVGFSRAGIALEAAQTDLGPLDVSKDFYPFGQLPGEHPAFYLGCKQVFSRKGASVQLGVTLSRQGLTRAGDAPFRLKWEYSSGEGWSPIAVQSSAGGEYNFDHEPGAPVTLAFDCPRDWAEGAVNGKKNYWLRVRVANGDYGALPAVNVNSVTEKTISALSADRTTLTVDQNTGYTGGEYVLLIKGSTRVESRVSGRLAGDKLTLARPIPGSEDFKDGVIIAPPMVPGSLQSPVVSKISLAFTYMTGSALLDHCFSKNDFRFEDHTVDSRWLDRTFTPFVPVADSQPAVHLGFDRRLPEGLVSLYVQVPDEPAGVPDNSPFTWEYFSTQGWRDLGVMDETGGFRQSGLIQFIGQPDALPSAGMGGELYRIRASLKQGESMTPLAVRGVWVNAVWAEERQPATAEQVGISDGNPGQTFNLQRAPVLVNETRLEVQEWSGRGEGWRTTLADVPERDLRCDSDPATGTVTAAWVTWHEQPHLYLSQPGQRHYTIERARGLLRLGEIPPTGSRIVLTYSSGGGAYGNVPAGAIKEPRMAIPYIQSVSNPVAASGGADLESIEMMRERGAQRLRHHDQGVSAADCEWLARQASPDVARVRCLPVTGPDGKAQRGWITLIVVPAGLDPRPQPSVGFGRRVREYLSARVPAAVSRQVRVVGPRYRPISVRAKVTPRDPGEAALVETRLRDAFNAFLHPLNGGPDGRGWEFGQDVHLSQLARLIEHTAGVDYASDISLGVDEQVFADFVPIEQDALPCAGGHEIRIVIGKKVNANS